MIIFKKILACLIAAVLLGACALVSTTAADQETVIAVGTATGRPGDIVAVPITVSSNAGIAGLLLGISYDTTALEAQSVVFGCDLTNGTLTDNLSDTERTSLHILWFDGNNFTGNGEIIVINFKVLSEAPGTQALTVKYNAQDIRSIAGQLPVKVKSGAVDVVITNTVPGDMDGSGIVDIDDAIYLLKAVFDSVNFPIAAGQNPDCDGNKSIDIDDAIYLLKHVFDKENFPIAN